MYICLRPESGFEPATLLFPRRILWRSYNRKVVGLNHFLLSWLTFFVAFLSISRRIPWQYIQIGHDSLVSNTHFRTVSCRFSASLDVVQTFCWDMQWITHESINRYSLCTVLKLCQTFVELPLKATVVRHSVRTCSAHYCSLFLCSVALFHFRLVF